MIERPDIEAIWEYYGLRIIGGDRGGWRKATCPLPTHEDNNPSASVNTEEGKWHCHACSETGDGLDVIEAREDVTGFRNLKARADEITGGRSSSVPRERDRSGLLSGRPRSGSGSRGFTPPWKVL